METPSQIFADSFGMGSDDRYARIFDDDRRAVKLGQQFPLFAEKVVYGEAPFPTSAKVQPSGLDGVWDGTEETTGIDEADVIQPQPMYVQPGLYADDDDDILMGLRDRTRKTAPVTPDLLHSKRPTSSLKSESSQSSRLSRSTNITPPDPEPRKKRIRKTKIKSEPEDDKRDQFLERNRIAASKCREKKKQYVSGLEERKMGLENQRAQLQVEYNNLVAEVGTLKHTLMTHGKCNDPNIDTWIANEARKFVHTSDLFGHYRAAVAASAGESSDLAHTRRSSTSSFQRGAGMGSFSSAGTEPRRDSFAYSQGMLFD